MQKIILKYFGLPKSSHEEIIQMAIISEKRFETLGEVKKSPSLPKGYFEL